MANCGKDILLNREGTEQQQRYLGPLNPDWVKLNDFGLEEWMKFAWNFAQQVNYFESTNDRIPAGNWQDFFLAKDELTSFLKDVESNSSVTPHLALYLSFIKLLEFTKQHFNRLTQRHLDFYYREVLRLEKQAHQADQVNVLFELAKNVVAEQLEKATELDGGKDSEGNKRIYQTKEELLANQTQVAELKNVYNDHSCKKIKATKVADSYDGNGTELPDGTTAWWPFGHYESSSTPGFPELDDAKIGFSLAGEILELAEGDRYVRIALEFNELLSKSYSHAELGASLEMYCTGEKGWLGPFSPVENVTEFNGSVVFKSGSDSDDLAKLFLLFNLPKDEEALVAYDSEVHGEAFASKFPVCRILFKMQNTKAFDLYRDWVDRTLKQIKVDVLIEGMNALKLYNDIGDINSTKPFYPFGTQPVKKSKFYIDCPELYKKKWEKLAVSIRWKNTPDDFVDWYAAYRSTFKASISATDFVAGIFTQEYLDSLEQAQNYAQTAYKAAETEIKAVEIQKIQYNNLIISDKNDFTAAAEILRKEDWSKVSGKDKLPLFDTEDAEGNFSMNFELSNPSSEKANTGPLRLSMNQTFLHEMYPRLYALAMSSEDKNVLIPNEPYTPYVEILTLNYWASAKIVPDGNSYSDLDFELYHEHPFGQAVENIETKLENGITDELEAEKLRIVPAYCKGGEFYIGLEKAKTRQVISLLFQLMEGSENPEAESFVGNQKMEWWILCNNDWKQLESGDILVDETDNLLQSGIFRFTLPKEASSENTLLPPGNFWLRARMHKRYDVVSRMIAVHAQAVTAQFINNNNSLSHLSGGLAADTISKMISRKPRVKGVAQPYNSFGGRPQESDADFYRRVSERLRHKNRAITAWDYEHLLLQNFPEIHKVKCLNHTSTTIKSSTETGCSTSITSSRKTSYLAPGNVVLIVIPDIVNRNVFDIYKPRVSKATLNRIGEFFHNLISPLVQLTVLNPAYEEVSINLKVQFVKGFDKVHYTNVLKNDLTRLLSPWAFDKQASIRFGISLHKSVVVNFVEKLEYVDFVADLKLFQFDTATGTEKEVNTALPSCPEAILVSSKSHTVEDYENLCTIEYIEPAETCQK